MNRILSCQVSEELSIKVDAIAKSLQISRNSLLKQMIELYVDNLEKEAILIVPTAALKKKAASLSTTTEDMLQMLVDRLSC